MRVDPASRTFIGSVVCVDLVGYSKRPIAQQSAVKQAFNERLAQALQGVRPEDRIILDTGDGASITFLEDPEACLRFGVRLRDAMNSALDLLAPGEDEGPVRIGINLGPVRLAVDLNGRPNIIGDGINVAETIAAFARPGQVVVTRSFHDMVSRISEENARRFRHEGVRADAHAREHELYALDAEKVEALPQPAPPPTIERDPGLLAPFLRDKKKSRAAAALLVAVIAIAVGVLAARQRERFPEPAATTPAVAPPPVVEAKPPPTEAPSGEAPKVEAPKVEAAKVGSARVAAPKVEAPRPEAPKVEANAEPEALPQAEPPPAPVVATNATPILRPPPNFPLAAVNRGIESGTVRARLAINAAGSVTGVTVVSAEPARVFDREAIRALEEWKFNPGADNRTYEVEIEFRR